MAELLALLAAGCFALGTTLQQRGTLETAAGEGDPRFLIQILQRPVWLLGGLFQVIGWILQAAALNRGSLDVVQSITALSLAIALPLGVWLTSQQVGRRQVVGALQTVGGIVVFVAVGSPETGTTHPTATAWWFASLACGAAVVALAGLGWRRRGATGAVLLGAGAGVGFAFQAAVTKLLVHQLGGGLSHVLTAWTPYVLIATAAVSFVLQQSALKTGALAPAMASSNSVTLVVSVIMGSTMFGETISGGGSLILAIGGLVLAVSGIVLLATGSPHDGATRHEQLSPRTGQTDGDAIAPRSSDP
ncbi:MAG TPA: DMT family transporter [Acidimicrobiales bacterium]|nr:DMT family transporter [Acidimicrobiales bacterium]